MKYPCKSWCWSTLSTNPNIDHKIIENFGFLLNWELLSLYINLSIELIDKYYNLWVWNELSANKSITRKLLKNTKINWHGRI